MGGKRLKNTGDAVVNSHMQSHLFWGVNSPLSAFTGVSLIVIASGQITSAVVCVFALLWVNSVTLFVSGIARKTLPEKGSEAVLVFVSSFAGFLFYFFLSIVSPFQAMESALCILLCPVFLAASGIYLRTREYDTPEMVTQAASEALVLGMLVLGLALIREPLGSGSVSLPGLGIIRFMREQPLALLNISSGALILLGYGTALYRNRRNQYTNQEDD
ncbi:MAG: hypothetical protein LBI67_00335 [Treponema sp.]|jgi:hypothetical protein|nr:hypothetical protein [Treponema sp.]